MSALPPLPSLTLSGGSNQASLTPQRCHSRRWPIGAEPLAPGSTHFRVWAPCRTHVEVQCDGKEKCVALEAEGNGYFSGQIEAGAGTRYRFRLDGDSSLYPDPVSRYQPDGPHGPSEVVDPLGFSWTDSSWRGAAPEGRVVYEMHIGTFTPEGTWRAALEQLPRLADLGVNLLEVMPVAEFPGRFGWGYDGVDLFAPSHLYGKPDDFRAFVDRAHALGIGVILDVVYNHVGPDGNYLEAFSPTYFSESHQTDWGKAINFDGPDSEPVREFFLSNAASWISEYHLDGLRLDATQNIYDDSTEEHVLAAIARVCREAAGPRSIVLIAENEPQEKKLVRPPSRDGYGLDMLWNDDFHHTAHVALTGRTEAYYTDYRGQPQELVSAVKYGPLYQGQYYTWQKQNRGTPAFDLAAWSFVAYLDNHDQVANSARGLRSHALTSPGRYRAMTALLLLGPGTPMLFQGQEFASSSPFYYFADHRPELAALVRSGRLDFLSQFPSIADPATQRKVAAPHDPETFRQCKLDPKELTRNAWAVALHRDLLRLRREDPVFRRQDRTSIDGAILAPEAFVLRFFADDPIADRLLLVNLGPDLRLGPMPEPLLAAPFGCHWQIHWSSESPSYGGGGTGDLGLEDVWTLPGHSAVVLTPDIIDS